MLPRNLWERPGPEQFGLAVDRSAAIMAAVIPDILTRKDSVDAFLNKPQEVHDRLLHHSVSVPLRDEDLALERQFMQRETEEPIEFGRVSILGFQFHQSLNQLSANLGSKGSVTS